MKTICWMLAGVLVLGLAGCGNGGASPSAAKAKEDSAEETEIQANLAKLSPEDRPLAEAQKFCCVEEENRLGSMGKPEKVVVKGQPVFLCCKGCRDQALTHPEETLKKAQELKAKNARH